MEAATISPTTSPVNISAADTPAFDRKPLAMDARVTTGFSIASTVEAEAATPPPRLLDSDPSKFRSLKQVIVIGRPGSGTDGIGDALKKLNFKVYDFQAASNRYERDFPLWVEAARLRNEGRPYNQSDYDKLIGDHNALVGAPTSFFDGDFVKLYPNVKVILVTRQPDASAVAGLLERVASRFWCHFDPVYHGNMYQFIMLNGGSELAQCVGINEQVIREAVREKNLLEIHNLVAWVPLCRFLGVPVPDMPAPELHDNAIEAELAVRPQRALSETLDKVRRVIVKTLTYTFTMALITATATLAVIIGALVLVKLFSMACRLFDFLVVRSQICDVMQSVAVGAALIALLCGFVAGYALGSVRQTKVVEIASPTPEYQRKFGNSRRKGKQGRGRQSHNDENTRPERPVLPSWSGAQNDIRRDDAAMYEEGRASFEEWKNDKHVTFHVTHKRTEGGQQFFSGPRKVLSVTEETIE
ncbi:uncharacterized protein EKO05_0008656 [Ascochyta rabiei]|uniref:Uncharacterized protein n=1 Tax=Didymella rabiei TaxID=5454 RepID=A0A163FUU7_DIDRA|nr:uncharacterized protein EKO05_0008656 [Ascochyta rabiei]KZM24546.1 hypothetical protein ST47_g4270 [Ascochyta rabiei]UPX18354.1 hypothetical protein EKO05_0008656 [Ascochyta rabiei]